MRKEQPAPVVLERTVGPKVLTLFQPTVLNLWCNMLPIFAFIGGFIEGCLEVLAFLSLFDKEE
jgi:hypothetical protein